LLKALELFLVISVPPPHYRVSDLFSQNSSILPEGIWLSFADHQYYFTSSLLFDSAAPRKMLLNKDPSPNQANLVMRTTK